MNRREFVGTSVVAAAAPQAPGRVAPDVESDTGAAPVIERHSEGRPHRDKVLAVISPHSDDFTIFNGGLVAKLIDEGYKAYLIRVTNDEKCQPCPAIVSPNTARSFSDAGGMRRNTGSISGVLSIRCVCAGMISTARRL